MSSVALQNGANAAPGSEAAAAGPDDLRVNESRLFIEARDSASVARCRRWRGAVMKAPSTDPGLWELFALLALAALGFGSALARDDLMFSFIFAAACGVSIVGLLRHLR